MGDTPVSTCCAHNLAIAKEQTQLHDFKERGTTYDWKPLFLRKFKRLYIMEEWWSDDPQY